MRKFKIDKNLSTRLAALSAAGIILVTGLTGCKSKENKTESVNSSIVTMVEDTNNKIDTILPEASDEIVDNASIMLLLDVIAKEDENGKISADVISEFKSKLDVDDMISEFTSFLDMIGFNIKESGKVVKVSTVLPEELNDDKVILSNIETILENIIKYSKEGNKTGVASEFDKIYTLFVEEKELEVNGTTFEIRDLSFPSRAVATTYAETAAYYATNYVSKEKLEKLDNRTNDQNNKAYIKSKLEILDNQMEEKSEVDVISLFDTKYKEVTTVLNGKVNLSETIIKNLVNYMNLKYINGDKVSTKDMNTLVGEYDDEKVNEVITAIEAINTYNFNNQTNIIPFSIFLVDEHLKTESGQTDKIALDFVQYNSIMLNNTDDVKTYKELSANPYFKNIFKYFTKQDFTHIQNDENKDIVWQEVSDGVNFVNYQVILNSLNKLPKVDNKENYIEVTNENLGESIQYIQNTIMGECKKVDIKQYVK